MPDVKPTTVHREDPQAYEDAHVHAVYDQIADHFSASRYKPWPIVAAFLSSLPTGWVGVDLGTGNGKYLPLPEDRPGSIWTIGLDRSLNLLKLAQRAGNGEREVVWADVLDHPWRLGAFDYAISVATIHHLATAHRRKTAVQRLLQCISPAHGRALIYVWAVEQDELSKRTIPTDAHAGAGDAGNDDAGDPPAKGQDVFVPWVLSGAAESTPQKTTTTTKKKRREGGQTSATDAPPPPPPPPPKVFDRYYHMFARGELAELVAEAAGEMGLALGDPDAHGGGGDHQQEKQKQKQKQQEQKRSCEGVRQGLRIVAEGWERSNYYVQLERWER